MPILELSEQQLVELIRQLPPGRQRSLLKDLTHDGYGPEGESYHVGEASVKQRFRDLARQWKDETQFTSSVTDMVTHPAYQQIIGMGRAVVPLILRELRREQDHWFWALQAITGENPVPPVDRGRVEAMTEAWLDWAAAHGY